MERRSHSARRSFSGALSSLWPSASERPVLMRASASGILGEGQRDVHVARLVPDRQEWVGPHRLDAAEDALGQLGLRARLRAGSGLRHLRGDPHRRSLHERHVQLALAPEVAVERGPGAAGVPAHVDHGGLGHAEVAERQGGSVEELVDRDVVVRLAPPSAAGHIRQSVTGAAPFVPGTSARRDRPSALEQVVDRPIVGVHRTSSSPRCSNVLDREPDWNVGGRRAVPVLAESLPV